MWKKSVEGRTSKDLKNHTRLSPFYENGRPCHDSQDECAERKVVQGREGGYPPHRCLPGLADSPPGGWPSRRDPGGPILPWERGSSGGGRARPCKSPLTPVRNSKTVDWHSGSQRVWRGIRSSHWLRHERASTLECRRWVKGALWAAASLAPSPTKFAT